MTDDLDLTEDHERIRVDLAGYVLGNLTLPEQQRAVAALVFKCDLLWAQLEAIDRGDTRPGRDG